MKIERNLRVMFFIDGTNLLCRLEDSLNKISDSDNKFKIKADKLQPDDVAMAASLIDSLFKIHGILRWRIIRKFWYSSYRGSDQDRLKNIETLWGQGFEPVIFRKKGNREKGVDIALTMSMLTNAFNQNYDLGILVAGDEDYIELVKEVKRYGPQVHGAFLGSGLSDELRFACDHFYYFEPKIADGKVVFDCSSC